MNQGLYKKKHTVKYHEINATGHIRVNVLGLLVQQVAIEHVQLMNKGYEALLKQNKVWMMARIVYELYHSPKLNEEISVETWIEHTDRVFSYQNCNFYDSEKRLFAATQTAWIVVDIFRRKVEEVGKYVTDFVQLPVPGAIKTKTRRLKPFATTPQHVVKQHVMFSAIDVIQHVNNTKYIEWFVDSLPDEFLYRTQIETLSINYICETYQGDILDYCYIWSEQSDSVDVDCKVLSEKENNIVVTISAKLKYR